ncbi:MAG: hypothetical protein JXQ82_08545 [Methanomicrobiaceae archaeon]|nr:hypothetical protein [Methanomicrobiaceae archaeon]
MKCRIFLKRENSVHEFSFKEGSLISDVLLMAGIIPDTVIIFKDNVPVTEDSVAEEADYVVITTSSRG